MHIKKCDKAHPCLQLCNENIVVMKLGRSAHSCFYEFASSQKHVGIENRPSAPYLCKLCVCLYTIIMDIINADKSG